MECELRDKLVALLTELNGCIFDVGEPKNMLEKIITECFVEEEVGNEYRND